MAANPLSQVAFAQAAKPEPTYSATIEDDVHPPQRDDDWTQIESEAAVIIENDNYNFWAKGELALRVERRYKEQGIKRLAATTKLGAAKTLYEHAQLADFFPASARAQVPTLLKEHFRLAYRVISTAQKPIANKLGAAMAFLKQADEGVYKSAAEMGREMQKQFGQEVKTRWRFEEFTIREMGGYLVLDMPPEEVKRAVDMLRFQGQETWKAYLGASYVHPAA